MSSTWNRKKVGFRIYGLWLLSVVLWPWTLAISKSHLTPFRFSFLSQTIETFELLALDTQGFFLFLWSDPTEILLCHGLSQNTNSD